jgi:hypothetical protein
VATAHAETDDGDQRDAALDGDAVDEVRAPLAGERLLERGDRSARLSRGETKQMLASLEAWLIIDTECPACDSAVKARPATPGTPIMPPPSIETSACARTAVSALTG